jgi:hypothetical protein
MILTEFFLILVMAFVCEWIDSALGMGYGTILSPLLLIFGFSPLVVVPSILLTQAFGGLTASIFHHRKGNANFSFKNGLTEDMKTVLILTSLGVLATIASAIIAVNISKTVLTSYISLLVIVMGLFVLFNFRFVYTTGKMILAGVISAFNKGLYGGGFGPVVTGGQIVLGKEHKSAIACTTAAEPLICIVGFITYVLLKGMPEMSLIYSLGIGAIIAGIIGPRTTQKINKQALRYIVGFTMVILGILSVLVLLGVIKIKIGL